MNNHRISVLVSFLGGVAAGTIVGLLFAPDSGPNTRDRISYQVDKYLQRINELLARAQLHDGKIKVPDLSTLDDKKKAEEVLRELLREVESQVANMKS